jgi:hypothetical protein
MICERCQTREAVIHLTQVHEGQRSVRHFCPECARVHGAAVVVTSAEPPPTRPASTGRPALGADRDRAIVRSANVSRLQLTFAALVLAQAAHSIEEYVGGLWETFPPAAFVTGLVSSDRERGFLVINCVLVAFAVWCLLWPVRRAWPSARAFVWLWIGVDVVNGVGHLAWSLRQGSYTPGVLTAPLLLALALSLVLQLRRSRRLALPGERDVGGDRETPPSREV